MKVTMAHGSGGKTTSELIDAVFAKTFANPVLDQMEDSAVVPGNAVLALTTDSFVVDPVEFPGGDIGRLCICGTVNDLLMRGARPQYITCGFILQEGLDTEVLQRVVKSMADTAREAGVQIVAGDTKVVEAAGNAGGLYINTAGVGFVENGTDIAAGNCRAGDAVLVSGALGDHHATILSQRMEIQNSICSDNAPLSDMVGNLLAAGIPVHTLRDVTRGGLATVLKELAVQSGTEIELEEQLLPVHPQVQDFCGLLGLDPLYMGNEGKMVAIVPEEQAERALEIIRSSRYGAEAVQIGRVKDLADAGTGRGQLTVLTSIGGKRILDVLQGEGLPRIC